jgi:hypothetical protein
MRAPMLVTELHLHLDDPAQTRVGAIFLLVGAPTFTCVEMST